jgi:hypothetical protein
MTCKGTVDVRMMRYLLDRSTLVFLSAKGKHGENYVPGLNVTHLERGTGVFIERDNRGYVATAEHVIRPRTRECRGVPVSVAVALGYGTAAAEDHTHFIPSARCFEDDGHGNAKLDDHGQPISADTLTGFDLALIALSQSSFERAKREGKNFMSWPIRQTALQKGDKVCFRGYCAGDVDLVNSCPPGIVGDGYTLFLDVTEICNNCISVDATEERVCYGKGTPNADRDLHGVSGAGLFDMAGNLRAIVWGGILALKVVYACPVEGLVPLFEKYDQSAQ